MLRYRCSISRSDVVVLELIVPCCTYQTWTQSKLSWTDTVSVCICWHSLTRNFKVYIMLISVQITNKCKYVAIMKISWCHLIRFQFFPMSYYERDIAFTKRIQSKPQKNATYIQLWYTHRYAMDDSVTLLVCCH